MEDLTTFGSGLQLSHEPSTVLPVMTSLRPLHPPSKYGSSSYLSPAASRKALRASAYRSQRSSTYSTASSPRPHLHAGLPASFFQKRQTFNLQCSVRAYIRIDALSEDSVP